MRLHNNGRMMDIYWRLHGLENSFFLPYDLELSNEELGYICRKAEKWRGQEGEQRKISVYHYTWEEEEVGVFYYFFSPALLRIFQILISCCDCHVASSSDSHVS